MIGYEAWRPEEAITSAGANGRGASTPASMTDASPLPVDGLTLEEAVGRALALLRSGRGGQIVTLNPEIVMRARRDPGLRSVITRAALVTADGMGIVWGARLAGLTIPERVTGIDLSVALLARTGALGYDAFLLGAARGVAETAARAITARLPGARIAGVWSGDPQPVSDAEAVARVRASGARLLLVAYGAPMQEQWIARNLTALPGVVAIGVGGALDMIAGRAPRAPRWMRAAGLEWLYRLAREPGRWRRMLALPAFAALAVRSGVRARLAGAPAMVTVRSAERPRQTGSSERI
ncbi:MAG TPA: WecB/TagA/CpsF family glycosyltransferase [Ktedonobacterales bacterium]|nr:WecB/TagA/CpsF family glycosyltransferase [Ktedonobacterales bacterium]